MIVHDAEDEPFTRGATSVGAHCLVATAPNSFQPVTGLSRIHSTKSISFTPAVGSHHCANSLKCDDGNYCIRVTVNVLGCILHEPLVAMSRELCAMRYEP